MRIIGLFLLTIFTFPVWAGDAPELEFIGFSKEGKYLAFQQAGIFDGKGTTYATLHFMEVATNQIAADTIETEIELGNTPIKEKSGKDAVSPFKTVKSKNMQAGKATLDKLGIVAKNTGVQVISRSLYDVGADPKKVGFAIGTPLAGLSHETYALTLDEKEGKEECGSMGKSKLFALNLQKEDATQPRTVQKEGIPPQALGCPVRYRIGDTYVYQEKWMVMFLNVFTAGFEGENLRYFAITWVLERGD